MECYCCLPTLVFDWWAQNIAPNCTSIRYSYKRQTAFKTTAEPNCMSIRYSYKRQTAFKTTAEQRKAVAAIKQESVQNISIHYQDNYLFIAKDCMSNCT